MARKSSVYLAEDTISVLEATGPEVDGAREVSISGRINAIVGRYERIVREHSPSLTLAEWCAICDANNGTMLDVEGAPEESRWMWANVADSEGLGEKWGIDQNQLVRTMRGWSYAESLACAEIVGRFWANCGKDNEEALRDAGAKIEPEADKPKKRRKP